MASAAKSGQGSLLKIGDGASPEVFATIGEVGDIKGPKIKNSFEDVTSHDSTGGLEEFIATFTTQDSVKFEANYLPANATQSYAAGLLAKVLNRGKTNFQLVPAGQSVTLAFAAYVEEWELSLPVKGVQKISVSLKPSGVLTQT